MSSFTLALVTFLAFATYAGSATAQSAVPAPPGTETAKPMLTLQMPPIPDPVRVTLKPASTAVLVFDIVDPICTSQPKCVKTMVPAITALLARARKAGITVGYGTRAPTMSKWMPEVAPAAGDVTFVSYAQDRFFNTELDKTLKAKGGYDAHSHRMEDQWVRTLHVGWSNVARLYGRDPGRCESGAQRL